MLKFIKNSFAVFSDHSNFPSSIDAIAETGRGSIVLKTGRNELIELFPDSINKRKTRDSLSLLKLPITNTSQKIYYEGKHLLASASDSIYIFDESKSEFRRMEYPANFLNESVEFEVLSHDLNGNLWFTGRSRISHVPLGIFLFRIQDNKLKLVSHYSANENNSGSINDLIKVSEGNIVFATNQKLIFAKSSETKGEKLRLIIELSGKADRVMMDNESIIAKSITRTHLNNSLNVKFFCDYPETGRSIIYRYKLDGRNKIISSWNSGNEANFINLSSGNYLLTVEAISLTGPGYGKLEIPIHINLPFYLKWYLILIYLFLIFVLIIVYVRWKSFIFLKNKIKLESIVSQRTEELQNEKEKSEQLWPIYCRKDTADELKKKGKASSQKYEMVTVLFSDIQGFTKIAEQMNPEALIDQLDNFIFILIQWLRNIILKKSRQ